MFLRTILLLVPILTAYGSPRAPCPTPNGGIVQCELDCSGWGYCANNEWDPQPCDESRNEYCDYHVGVNCSKFDEKPAHCTGPSNKNQGAICINMEGRLVPDLETECDRSYYYCKKSNEAAEKLNCPQGMTFHPCKMQCSTDVGECYQKVECTSNSLGFTPLTTNKQYEYACLKKDGETDYNVIWAYNPNATSVCSDGNCFGTVGPTEHPLTNCKYIYCFADGTSKEISCSPGYVYVQGRGCIFGSCY